MKLIKIWEYAFRAESLVNNNLYVHKFTLLSQRAPELGGLQAALEKIPPIKQGIDSMSIFVSRSEAYVDTETFQDTLIPGKNNSD
jgi:hypothetical protein